MKPHWLRLLCIALLLFGQHAALTHGLAHVQDAAGSALAQAPGGAATDEDAPGERYTLCDFHYAYSQVLGAVHAVCAALPVPLVAYATWGVRVHAAVVATEVPFLIRGPPQLV